MAEPVRWQDQWWHQQPDGSWLLFNESTQTWEPYGGAQGTPLYAPSTGMSSGGKWAIGLGIAAALLIVIMILAAIAIPVFLRQREKGWESQVRSTLKNAGTAQESYCTVNRQCYTDSVPELEQEGLRIPADVTLMVVTADRTRYCIEAIHSQIPNEVWSYDSLIGDSRNGPCT